MTRENPTWGQERIANELWLKLGLRVSPRTVRKSMPKRLLPGPGTCVSSPPWSAFVRNHAQAIVACDFCVAMSVTFRMLYVFVVIEHASRRLLHINVTAHPTAAWTLQQLREAMPLDHGYRFLNHDRDSIFSQVLDQSIHHLGLRVLKTPPRAPQANAICERLIGTLRRECLDFVIPITEHHLRRLLQDWVVPICPWDQAFLNHLHPWLCRHKHTGITFSSTCGSWEIRSSAACTMNTGSKRRRRNAGTIAWRTTKERGTKHRRTSGESESFDSRALTCPG